MYHTIMIHTTNACNMNCPYCYVHQRPAGEITVEDVKAQLPYAHRLSALMDPEFVNHQEYAVDYFGGEPLLNFDTILELHDQLFSRGVLRVTSEHVQTNALLMTREKLDELNKRRIHMSYSFDGLWDPPESIAVHEQLLAEGVLQPDMAKVMVAPEHAGDLLENYAYFVDKLGWTLPDYTFVRDDIWSSADVDTAKVQLHLLVDDMVARTKASKDGKCYCVGCISLPINDMVCGKMRGKRSFTCHAGRYGMVFTHDRKIYPCTRFYTNDKCMLADVNTGEVYEDTIRRLAQLFNTHVVEECVNCKIRQFCNTGCAYSQYMNGNEERMKPIASVCELTKACYTEALRYAKLLEDTQAFRNFLAHMGLRYGL